ncbi:hypothetical protein [Candidatus Nitrotoga arctica]|uniref:hypothetical protein n=1 Tax=Candidatus Nitrotoga arctica TaxID=453162 RepID=UPI001EFBDEA2|nr:hypothetical protein [Candidatus Nitrotoga arctica]
MVIRLLDESDSSHLSFGSHNDALHFARHRAENVCRWISANNLDFVKRYTVGTINVVLNFRIIRSDSKYDLIFSAIPDWWRDAAVTARPTNFQVHVTEKLAGRNKKPMFVNVISFVECPDQVIPSLIRLEPAKDRNNLTRDIFAIHRNNAFEIHCIVADGKVCLSRITHASRDSDCVSGLIKRGSEIFERVCGDFPEAVGDCGAEFDLMKLVNAISVGLNSMGAWVIHKEFIDPSIEVVDVYLSARDAAL